MAAPTSETNQEYPCELLLANSYSSFFFFLYDSPTSLRIPLNLAKQAGQNSHVRLFQTAAAEDAPEGEKHMLGIFRVQKTDLQKRSSHPIKQALDLFHRRPLNCSFGRTSQRSDVNLVQANDNCVGQIERDVVRVGGDRKQPLARFEVLVAESVIFGPENKGHSAPARCG